MAEHEKSALAGRQQWLAEQDAAARARALAFDTSFIVQAPAGAGKTELLTQRYLGLLARVTAPEQIVAITFTRKAAAEMKERILLRLAKADDPPPPQAHAYVSWQLARAAREQDRTLGWGLSEQPERLRIATIDSLCASLVRQMPYLSRFGGMPRIAEQPQHHYEEAARRTVAAIEDFPAVAQALACLDNDAVQLRRLLVGMLAFREQWWPHVHGLRGGTDDANARQRLGRDLTASLQRLVGRELAQAVRVFPDQSAALRAAARFVAAAKPEFAALAEWRQPLTAASDDLPRWQALAALLLTGSGTPRKQFNARNGLPAGDTVAQAHAAELQAVCEWLAATPSALQALQAVARCPLPQYAEADLHAIETFAEVLVLAVAQLWAVFQEAGETDFSAIAERAIEALGDAEAPSELALRLDYTIRHLLVDEFQDTNPQQITLLEQLTLGWLPGEDRSLFVVGDPMQSIYRFRKADVGLFLRAWQGGIGGVRLEPLQLYRNNRSLPAVVEWVNASFPQLFPPEPDAERGRVAYAEAIPTRQPESGGGVRVHPVLVPKDGDDALADRREAETIVGLIEATWQVQPDAEIAVLVRAKDHLVPLTEALRRMRPDCPYEAVEIDALSARQPVQDVLALTRALCHRADRVNWLAILRAPWCGLTLADLHGVCGKVGAGATVWQQVHEAVQAQALSADGRRRLTHVIAALSPLLAAPGRLSLRRSVETAWRRLNGPTCLADATERADVAAYWRLLDSLEASGRFNLDRLDEEVSGLFAAASSDPQAARLKFMTIHKSKGLEFDTVILPGLHRRTGRHETRLLTWDSAQDEAGQPRLVVAPVRSKPLDEEAGEDDEPDAIRRYIAALEAERGDQEARRLLYVAATRTKRALHLVTVVRPKRDAKSGMYQLDPPKSASGTPVSILWPVLAGDCLAALPGMTTAASDSPAQPVAFVPRLQRLPAAVLVPSPHFPVPPVAEDPPAAAATLFAASPLAPDVGTLAHRYLELIAGEGLARWDAARLNACLLAGERWLRQQGHEAAHARFGAERVVALVTRMLGSERGRWLLQARAGAASELCLMQPEAGGLRQHIIDRTFIENGVRWIIDYKTSPHEGGDVDAFIAAKRAEYAPQLERYAALFVHEGLPVRQALYFLDLDRFEELT